MTRRAADVGVSNEGALAKGAADLGLHLSLAQLKRFQRYYLELVDWNRRVNLTSVTEWKDVQVRHFLDSLTVVLAIPTRRLNSGRFVDVGSGAGFPGIPLKIAFPAIETTLVEATGKKADFLRNLAQSLGLPGVDVRTGRAETLAHDSQMREGFDVALTRAVARMNVIAELTLPFCRLGGIVIAQKSIDVKDELAQAEKAVGTLGGAIREVKQVEIPALGRRRSLVVLEKIATTPERYPRRPGMPEKRPL